MRVELDKDIEARINRLAQSRNQSVSEVVTRAVEQYLERADQRRATLGDVMAAWEAYQADGLHVDEGAADAWLSALERGDMQDLPPARN